MRRAITVLCVVLFCAPAATAAADGWEELAFLPWGDGSGEVGLTEARDDELQRGPHGIAVAADGTVAVVDRVNDRALVLSAAGELERVIPLTGNPGPAALLPSGALAVVDERDDRRVKFSDDDATLRTPRWAMPPNRLVTHTDAHGRTVVEGLDGFQLRQPLSTSAVEPHELPRGVPTGDGGVYVVKRGDDLWVEFPEGRLVADPTIWPDAPAPGYHPGLASVLAARSDAAVLYLESVFGGDGPIRVERAVQTVDLQGRRGAPLVAAPMGPVVIPADLAALADGRVYQLVSDHDGCRLMVARVELPGVGR